MYNQIKKFSSQYFGFDIWKRTRKREYVEARYIVYLAVYNHFMSKNSLVYVAKKLGNQDHATFLHGIRKCKDIMEFDKDYETKYNNFEQVLLKLYNPVDFNTKKRFLDFIKENDILRRRIVHLEKLCNLKNQKINYLKKLKEHENNLEN